MGKVKSILHKAVHEEPLESGEIRDLLNVREKGDFDALFETARTIRSRYFAHKLFLYGFLYISTYCKNDCNFCAFRQSNEDMRRYRKDSSEIVEAARKLFSSGAHLIDLTMGEDSFYFRVNPSHLGFIS